MNTESENTASVLLGSPDFHGVGKDQIEIIETHISRIFLAGDRAWKVKRTVNLPYVDFSTPDLRYAACKKEIELNSRTAPELYVAAHRITEEEDGRLALDGAGKLVDGVVEMKRFDQDFLLDRMALRGELTPELISKTAHMIAAFHGEAAIDSARTGSAMMAGVLDINEAGFERGQLFDPSDIACLNRKFRAALEKHASLLDRRGETGKVRHCHGDLHLRNICLLDGEPRLFDCIEFNEDIATVDVLYDLAFLLMDLWHRGFGELANLAANRYVDEAENETGFTLLPFFMAVRAAVRAHVTATAIGDNGASDPRAEEAKSYFELANLLLEDHPPRLVTIAGLSGSGKTTVAEKLASRVGAPPGARIIESDRIRKALHGVSAETRLPGDAYRKEISEAVYQEMARRAGVVIGEGAAVVSDGVFERPADRARMESTARDCAVSFTGFWLDADATILRRRVEERHGGPSDASPDVLAHQLERDVDYADWVRIDAARDLNAIVADILECLKST